MSGVTLAALQRTAVMRSKEWHRSTEWSLSDWMTALVGEVGEAAEVVEQLNALIVGLTARVGQAGNTIKKLNRMRDSMVQSHVKDRDLTREDLVRKLHKEIADIQCYLPLLAEAAGADLEDATVEVFNEISEELGAPHRL